MTRGTAASVRQRLLNRARGSGENYNLLLVRYGIERFLYRLARGGRADEFVLKGANLFYVWTGALHRPTRDIDMLRLGPADPASVTSVVRACLAEPVEDDGLRFDADSIEARPIREAEKYPGARVTLRAYLGTARIALQLDVGAGDAIEPDAEVVEYPSLIGLPTASVRAYRFETSIAEKCEAMVKLGLANTRLKDFYDVFVLARDVEFEIGPLSGAVRATFARRVTPVPEGTPPAWSPDFVEDEGKCALWAGFLARAGLEAPPLEEVARLIERFLAPALREASGEPSAVACWSKGEWDGGGGRDARVDPVAYRHLD